uniref:Pyridoxamine 5'-phosphate oxidase family protein n=1 Tax=Roseihalotalea indica TaxID=2867963 RepID=A0AA49JJX7_9BACT|nr:pyridoxamine 5'-phosphate oxidase family protein [Tunicatimonas sp. TK19036]
MHNQPTHPEAAIKLREKIEKIDMAMLTTEEPDGHFRSRPMSTTEVDSSGIVWFFTSDQSDKVKAIQRNPKVNLAYSDPKADTWISVSGTAELIKDKAKMHDLWSPVMKAWFAQGLDTPDIALLEVTVEKAEYWDVTSNVMVQLYAFAKATVTGKSARDEVGNNEKLDIR